MSDMTFGSLPYRQLRNITGWKDLDFQGSLPHRQLRNAPDSYSLPYRQLRNILINEKRALVTFK